jgi:hypothetical protein
MSASEEPPASSLILYQTEDGQTRVQCRFEDETIWLTQALLGELFQKDLRTINEHLQNIFAEGELSREATIRKFRIVRSGGAPGHSPARTRPLSNCARILDGSSGQRRRSMIGGRSK